MSVQDQKHCYGMKSDEELTSWTKGIAMDLLFSILDSNLLRQQHHSSLRCTISTRVGREADQA